MAEVVAAVAVVLSLVYVGRELRSNTAAVRGTVRQAISDAASASLLPIAADSALSRIRQLGDEDPSLLDEAEAYCHRLVMRQFWAAMANVYDQHELGLLDSQVWSGYLSTICGAWARTGPRETWPDHRPVVARGFAELVEACAPQ